VVLRVGAGTPKVEVKVSAKGAISGIQDAPCSGTDQVHGVGIISEVFVLELTSSTRKGYGIARNM
jgi:hypothetical protein